MILPLLYEKQRASSSFQYYQVYLFRCHKKLHPTNSYKDQSMKEVHGTSFHFYCEPTVEDEYVNNEQYNNQQKKVNEILTILTPRQKGDHILRFIQEMSMEDICILMD